MGEHKWKELRIGDKIANLPIIQGGMGVGISLSRLAGAVAKEGGVGVISTAQIGYDEEGFEKDQAGCNRRAIRKHIQRAKEIACGNGLVGVIISGAGLPMSLPGLIGENCKTKIAPIVSSKRATQLILKMWSHKYDRTADFIVIEGPKAGGHLGFSREQLAQTTDASFDEEIQSIIDCKREYEEKYETEIPVIVAGGIFDGKDISHALELGADGVQIASRFVATEECDASEAYKQAYIHADEKDVQIIQSPVGMPGRALRNRFIEHLEETKMPISKCYNCLEKCNPARVPYCITKALIDAVKGDVDNGLVFCGANVGRIHEMTTVHALMQELLSGI